MKDLRSYHNAMGPEALAALVTDPANFTIVESTATRTQSTAAPGACASTTSAGAGSAVDFTELDARRIHLEQPPPQPVPVFSLLSQQISTAGNLTVISAQAKGGKSAIVGAMIASIMAGPAPEIDEDIPDFESQHDLLGFTAASHEGRAVVLFDTEQSPYDAWNLVNRSAQRAGVSGMPVNFRGYSLADVSTDKRRAYLAAEMQRAHQECGGIHSVFIDGVADLCKSPNDDIEAFALVEHLAQLAIAYACPFILVLHENPSGLETGKTRGHLGSQLERKAESNLRIAKDGKSGASMIFSERCRHACISRDNALRFAWSTSDGMHMTVEAETKESRAEAESRADVVADRLADLALQGDVLVLAHGFFNTLVGRSLRRHGWKLKASQGYKYWAMRRFERGGGMAVPTGPELAVATLES